MQVEDGRRHSFFIVDNATVDDHAPTLGAYALAVYVVLVRFAGAKEQCWPSIKTIAERVKASQTTVRDALAKLEEAGLITVTGRADPDGAQTSNLYTIVTPKKGATPIPLAEPETELQTLYRAWRESFDAHDITPAQMKRLRDLAGGPDRLVATFLKVVQHAKGPIRNPYGLVRWDLEQGNKQVGNRPIRRREPDPLPYTPAGTKDEGFSLLDDV